MSNEDLRLPPAPEGWSEDLPTTGYAWMSEGTRGANGWCWLPPVFTRISHCPGEEPYIELLEISPTRDAGDILRSYDGHFIWKPVEKPEQPREPDVVRFRVEFTDDEGNECDQSFETRNDHLFPWLEDTLKLKSSGNQDDEWETPRELADRVSRGVDAFNELYGAKMKVVWL